MYKHILLTTDGSELSQRAVKHGAQLAKAVGAKLTIITVIKPWQTVAPAEVMISFPEDEYLKSAQAQADTVLEKAASIAKEIGVPCQTQHVIHESTWQAITEAAQSENCDLIVMGSHGRTGLVKLVLGSETQKVLAHSTVPVLVHR